MRHRACRNRPRPNSDTGGEFDVRGMFSSVIAQISLDRGRLNSDGRRSRWSWPRTGEFATSVNSRVISRQIDVGRVFGRIGARKEPNF